MKILILAICLAFALPSLTAAQAPGTDYQFRPLLHWQTGHLAGWVIVPDATRSPTRSPRQLLLVAGYLTRDEHSWKEVMFGAVISTDSVVKPVANFRSYAKSQHTDLYTEFQLRSNLALMSGFLTVPLAADSVGLRLGVECEQVHNFADEKRGTKAKAATSVGVRASVKIPKLESFSLATTWFKTIQGGSVARTYLVYQLKR